jgi:hypothetical protein
MTLATFYPLADHLTCEGGLMYRAQLTGEKRPPMAGEWYLSGAIPAAYRAPADMTTPYMICRIVKVRQVTTWEIVE